MNLWPVEHFFPHLFFQISADQRFICTEVTSYKLHILVYLILKVLALEVCNIELDFSKSQKPQLHFMCGSNCYETFLILFLRLFLSACFCASCKGDSVRPYLELGTI